MDENPRAYIWVNNWAKFQTYSKRRGQPWAPPWIKMYASLWEKDEFLGLPVPTRLMLLGIFNAFSTTRGRLSNDTRTLSRRLDQRVTNAQLELLNHAGFIRFCSETVREQMWNAFMNSSSPEVEIDRDTEVEVEQELTPNSKTSVLSTEARPPETAPENGTQERTDGQFEYREEIEQTISQLATSFDPQYERPL